MFSDNERKNPYFSYMVFVTSFKNFNILILILWRLLKDCTLQEMRFLNIGLRIHNSNLEQHFLISVHYTSDFKYKTVQATLF